MLERLFKSKTRVGILKLLLFRPGEQFHLRDIAKRVGVTPIYASKELANLSKLNIVRREKKANLSLYSLDERCAYLEELRRIFLKTDYLGEEIRREFSDSRYCFIFGSFASGEENKSSDVDLFVVSDAGHDKMMKKVQKLQKRTGREINPVLWDSKAFEEKKKDSFMSTILNDKVIMLIGDEGKFREEAGRRIK
jgi:predicted nucleotidyltransferase